MLSTLGATSSAWKPTVLWVPSQKGLLALCPQRHSENAVLPARSNAFPSASTTLISAPSVASTRYGPFFFAVIVTGMNSPFGRLPEPSLPFQRDLNSVGRRYPLLDVHSPHDLRLPRIGCFLVANRVLGLPFLLEGELVLCYRSSSRQPGRESYCWSSSSTFAPIWFRVSLTL